MLEMEQPVEMLDSEVPETTSPDSGDDNLEINPSSEAELSPEEQQAADELEEELEGVKLRGSKEAVEKFKAERLMQADYTRKTQEVADQRKAVEAREQQFQQTAQSHQAHIREVATLVAIDDRLAEFEKAGINPQTLRALADTDPVQALKLQSELQELQGRRSQVLGSITQKQHAQAEASQRETAKQMFDAQQVLARDIKGWSPELAKKLDEYASKSLGYGRDVLDNVRNPLFVKTVHKAYLYDQLLEKQAKKTPVEPAKPVSRISGSSAGSTKPLSEMSDDEYSAARRKWKQTHR